MTTGLPQVSASDTGSAFPRSARLLTAADYRHVFDRPRRSSDAWFTVLAARNDDQPARLGLAIAKKQVRQATQRNRLKRLARETFRRHRAMLQGYDFVVLARHAAARADNRELIAALAVHFERLTTRQRRS